MSGSGVSGSGVSGSGMSGSGVSDVDHTCICLLMGIQDGCHDYIPVYTDDSQDANSVTCATVFLSNTIIST